jgi:hypothetical protein
MATNILLLSLRDNLLRVRRLSSTKAREVATSVTTIIAAIVLSLALIGHVSVGPGLDVVVGNIAVISGLVPNAVAVDRGTLGLAGDGHLCAFGVGSHDVVAGAGT